MAAPSRRSQVQGLRHRYEAHSEMLEFLESRQQIRTHRPHPSSRDTSTMSISRRAASNSFSRASRRAAPELTSRTSKTMVQPRRAAYSRMARFCIDRVCWSFMALEHTGPPETFARISSLAENVIGFCFLNAPFYRRLAMTIHYYATAGLAQSRQRLAAIPRHPP